MARTRGSRAVVQVLIALALLASSAGITPAPVAAVAEGNCETYYGQFYTSPCPELEGVHVDEAPYWHEGNAQYRQWWTGSIDWGLTLHASADCSETTTSVSWAVSKLTSPADYDALAADSPRVSDGNAIALKVKESGMDVYGYVMYGVQVVCNGGHIVDHDAEIAAQTYTFVQFPGLAGTPKPTNHDPSATCTATQTQPGRYHFVADASDEDGDVLAYSWDFGDESPAETADNVTHDYALPGEYAAKLAVSDGTGGSVVADCPVNVPAPELQVSVSLPGHESQSLGANEEVSARVHVAAGSDGLGSLEGVQLETPGLLLAPDDGTLQVTDAADVTEAFDLAPGEGRDFAFDLRATGAGRVELSAHATATDAAGRSVDSLSGPLTVNVSVLTVELSISPDEINLVDSDSGPAPVAVVLTVKITNASDAEVDAIALLDYPDFLVRDGTQPAQAPIVVESGPSPNGGIGTLGAGESATRQFGLTARDDGRVRIQQVVEYADPDGGATPGRTSGHIDVDIDPDALIYLETTLTGAGGASERTIAAGSPQLITGFIENRSNDHTVRIDPLLPLLNGDIGNGYPVPTWRLLSSGPQNGCTLPLEGELQPGQRVEFQALVQTYLGEGTRATIDYPVSGALIESDGSETPLTSADIRIKSDSLPYTLHIDDSVATAPAEADDLRVKVAWFSIGAAQAVPQWLSSAFKGFVDFPRTLGELLGKGIASMPQAAEYLATYLYGVYQDEDGPHALALRIASDIAEATGKSFDELYDGVQASVDGWSVPYFEAYESGDYETSYQMLGQLGGNAALEILSCYAKLPEATRFIELAEHVKETGLAKRLSEGLRALKAGDIIPFDDMRRLYGIGIEQGAALKALAEEKGLLITARFRQPKSLEWIRNKLALLKPERIKLKNVDEIDVAFLGYNPAHEASVVVKRPLDLNDGRVAEIFALKETDKAAFDAALDAELSRVSADYAGAPPELKKAARERLGTRIKEWVSDKAGYVSDMRGLADRGQIELPWNYKDNFLPGTDGLPGTYTERRFRLLGDDPDYQIIEMADTAGDFRPVTGDIDIVGIQKANGQGLTTAERVEIYRILQETTGMQHPESATWISDKGEVLFGYKNELLADHAPGGEPLIQFSPDGKARAVFISPEMSYFNTATGNAHMWYVGGYRQSKPIVFSYGGTSMGLYFPDKAAPKFIPYVVPGQWVVDGVGAANPGDGTLGACRIRFGTGNGAAILAPDGRGGVRQYQPANSLGAWQMYDTSACRQNQQAANLSAQPAGVASVRPPTITILPQSGLSSPAAAGDSEIQIADLASGFPALFVGPGSYFKIGQQIVINPGADNEERRTIVALGSLILDQPLDHDHEVGELVSVLYPGQTGEPGSDTAYALKQEAAADLAALVPTGSAAADRQLNRATKRILRSLTGQRWTSDQTLDPARGGAVFNAERKAIRRLTRPVLGGYPQVVGAVELLISADKLLASTAIETLAEGPSKEAATAWLEQADVLAGMGRFGRAIKSYKRAWSIAAHSS